MHTNYYEHQKEADEVRLEVNRAGFFVSEFAALPIDELPGDQSHLSAQEQAGQERRLRMLTRKNQYSHGPELSSEEAGSLPPVKPSYHIPERS